MNKPIEITPEVSALLQSLYDGSPEREPMVPTDVARYVRRHHKIHLTGAQVRAAIRVHREYRIPETLKAEIRRLRSEERISRLEIAQRLTVSESVVARALEGMKIDVKHPVDRAKVYTLQPTPGTIVMREPAEIEVPGWVPGGLVDLYMSLAERVDEHRAAKICRALKHGKSVQGLSL